jgi:predicted CXXCH cytochrome family protein
MVVVASAQSVSMNPESRRECAVCHLQFVDEFDRTDAILLLDRPEEAVVTDEQSCLGCHDGSVGDSRRRVWMEHGHKTGVIPPETMKVPEILPLTEGKVTCRTCHTAHSGADTETIATAVFLRVPNDASQLCEMCHLEHTKGPELGTHPVGGMPWAAPDQIVAAGGRLGPKQHRLICQTCHTPHGARQDHLLVMGTDSSQLCLTCHKKLRPGLWRPELAREHPQNPPLSSEVQRQAIQDMGTKTGPGDTLICLSCHKLHHGQAGREMLADTLHDSQLCIRCHPDHKEMLNTAHDLRTNAPQERNRLGKSPDQSGPCGACHSFHQFARNPEPLDLEPTGLCATCHQPGQCAEKATGLPLNHPIEIQTKNMAGTHKLTLYRENEDEPKNKIGCLTCHDPHGTQHSNFLRHDPDALCAECHAELTESLDGPHDFTNHPKLKNGRDETVAETGKCGFCHGVHHDAGPAMMIATKTPSADSDDFCVQCHSPDGLAAAKPAPQFGHPTGPEVAAEVVDDKLPLFDDRGHRAEDGFVACASCHNPHADPDKSPNMLRVKTPTSGLCVTCHTEQALLVGSSHDSRTAPKKWPETARKGNHLCLACHQAHSDDPAQELWTIAPAEADEPIDGVCLACHTNANWVGEDDVHKSGATLHPEIECITCHDPHGAPDGPRHFLRSEDPTKLASVCADCHEQAETINASLHSQHGLRSYGESGEACGPCHTVHAREGSSAKHLWAGPPPAGKPAPGTERCLGCHGAKGKATRIPWVNHPVVALPNINDPETAGFLPLVNEQEVTDSNGRIGCITCHMPHGRPSDLELPEIDLDQISEDQLRALRPTLRPYTAPNLCSSCHGFEGIFRYLYYHDPQKRREQP